MQNKYSICSPSEAEFWLYFLAYFLVLPKLHVHINQYLLVINTADRPIAFEHMSFLGYNYMYVYVYAGDPGTARQFELQPNADTLGLPYDYHSVMHYPSTAFQKAPGLLTITPVNPNISADELGQIERLTDLDIEHVNRRYCNGKK